MKVAYVGVEVTNRAELKAVYDELVSLGYSESHSISVDNMAEAMDESHEDGEVFGLCVDVDRDILGVFDFNINKLMTPIIRCTMTDLGYYTDVFFPL